MLLNLDFKTSTSLTIESFSEEYTVSFVMLVQAAT